MGITQLFSGFVPGYLDLWPFTLTFKLLRARVQTRLACEFGANPSSGSRDIWGTNKLKLKMFCQTYARTPPSACTPVNPSPTSPATTEWSGLRKAAVLLTSFAAYGARHGAIISLIISERELTFTFAICYRPSVCLSVCNAGAPYSGGWNFRQYFYGVRYLGHPLTSTKNFTEIVPGERLRRRSWTQEG